MIWIAVSPKSTPRLSLALHHWKEFEDWRLTIPMLCLSSTLFWDGCGHSRLRQWLCRIIRACRYRIYLSSSFCSVCSATSEGRKSVRSSMSIDDVSSLWRSLNLSLSPYTLQMFLFSTCCINMLNSCRRREGRWQFLQLWTSLSIKNIRFNKLEILIFWYLMDMPTGDKVGLPILWKIHSIDCVYLYRWVLKEIF